MIVPQHCPLQVVATPAHLYTAGPVELMEWVEELEEILSVTCVDFPRNLPCWRGCAGSVDAFLPVLWGFRESLFVVGRVWLCTLNSYKFSVTHVLLPMMTQFCECACGVEGGGAPKIP